MTATLYNNLPTLDDAEKRFIDREPVFTAVGSLLAQYGNLYGLCLVHAHCTLTDKETMLSRGNISQPEILTLLDNYYPERWLASGVPYEFTTRPTVPPPAALVDEFNRLTADIGVLGLYHIGDEINGKKIEYTEGRKNILLPFSDTDVSQAANYTETAWNLGKGDPVTMACMIVCDSRNTRDGSVHKVP
ncbi:hypothetical protein N7522_001577 [Penicillium canescens]|uniref:Uncharacterized protein n=1 Tax=Penicillium canescens TaxID=5083 RepID=A0AAD6I252_PENCN|nr:uncharacterized protein N7446_003923 [Penicillium canescens]KAJ6019510.1 hypothetical protein N7522_001577 [Penicillium canescens]KAJ6027485.1 hypothetical protein N7460_012302 [Penicillium canescens]KAJ6040760.1 hypothetical protein N7444_009665 [Penicillium canescens]KAJ6066886.1 hypothetical protein N7446_003923 [Penicillium canescens]